MKTKGKKIVWPTNFNEQVVDDGDNKEEKMMEKGKISSFLKKKLSKHILNFENSLQPISKILNFKQLTADLFLNFSC